MTRVWLRAAALAVVVVAAVAGLTVYFSTEKVPRCLASGVKTWRPPAGRDTHRYEVVILDRSACFFDMDRQQRLVGALPLSRAKWLSSALPAASDTIRVEDAAQGVSFATRRGLLGFSVFDLHTNRTLYVTHFKGELPGRPPQPLGDIRLSKPISGDESPCPRACGRIGSLRHSADGRFVYVGDAGDVIDTRTREIVANVEALHNSRTQLEVDWVRGKAVFAGPR